MRAEVGHVAGWEAVGLWQVIARLSDGYMQVFGVLYINFFLPTLSKTSSSLRERSMFKIGGVFVLLFLCGALFLLETRTVVITTAFSAKFLAAAPLVLPQLVGDLLKVCTLALMYYFVATGRIWVQAAADVFQAGCTVLVFVLMVSSRGYVAPVYSHAVACGLLLIILSILFMASQRRFRWPGTTQARP
jgi:hypothetical protein